jgi:Uma2 family endonuclease
MVAAVPLRFLQPSPAEGDADERVVLRGVSWARYEALLGFLGDEFPGVRVTYLEGALELRSPSRSHESIKTMFARLVEAYAVEAGVDLNGYGSTTFRKRAKQRGVEPDECYSLGPMGKVPDIAFEVVWTSGGIDKLAVYAGLGVPEVWLWKAGAITVHQLGAKGDRKAKKSRFLPGVEVGVLAGFLERADQTRAVIEYRDGVRGKLGG